MIGWIVECDCLLICGRACARVLGTWHSVAIPAHWKSADCLVGFRYLGVFGRQSAGA